MKTGSAIAYCTMAFYTPSAMVRYLNLPAVWNRGIAFSMLEELPGWAMAAGFIALAYLSWKIQARTCPIRRWGTIILWGGALSNLMDRVVHGAVMDYIPVPLWPGGLYINIADLALITGALLILYTILRNIETEKE